MVHSETLPLHISPSFSILSSINASITQPFDRLKFEEEKKHYRYGTKNCSNNNNNMYREREEFNSTRQEQQPKHRQTRSQTCTATLPLLCVPCRKATTIVLAHVYVEQIAKLFVEPLALCWFLGRPSASRSDIQRFSLSRIAIATARGF